MPQNKNQRFKPNLIITPFSTDEAKIEMLETKPVEILGRVCEVRVAKMYAVYGQNGKILTQYVCNEAQAMEHATTIFKNEDYYDEQDKKFKGFDLDKK